MYYSLFDPVKIPLHLVRTAHWIGGYPDLHGGYLHLWISRRNGLRLSICQGFQSSFLTADSVLLNAICTPLCRYKCFYSFLCLTTNCQQYENPIILYILYILFIALHLNFLPCRTKDSWEDWGLLWDFLADFPRSFGLVPQSPLARSHCWSQSLGVVLDKGEVVKNTLEVARVQTPNSHLHYCHFQN